MICTNMVRNFFIIVDIALFFENESFGTILPRNFLNSKILKIMYLILCPRSFAFNHSLHSSWHRFEQSCDVFFANFLPFNFDSCPKLF